MKVDIFLPPAVEDDMGNVSGWLIRCKPEEDCASLYSFDDTKSMYGSVDEALADLWTHLGWCSHPEHAVVAVVSQATLNPEPEPEEKRFPIGGGGF